MAHEDETLLKVLRGYRQAFDLENTKMSPVERDQKFKELWNRIGSKLSSPASVPLPGSLVPQKRPAAQSSHFGLEPSSKRSAPTYISPTAPHLERHISAPAGLSPTMTTTTLVPQDPAAKSKPINIPRLSVRPGRRSSASVASQVYWPRSRTSFNNAENVRDMEYLGHSPDSAVQPTPSFAFTAPEVGYGEWHAPDSSMLTVVSSKYDGAYSPVTATSDSCLTSGSTAFSEPMSRRNTNDQICESFGMFHMEPSLGSLPDEPMRSMAKPTYPSTFSDLSHVDVSNISFSQTIPSYQSLSVSSAMMKPSLSQESVASSSSSSFSSSDSPLSYPAVQQAQAKPRVLAPKKQDDASKQPPMPKLVAIKGEDGTIKHKAEIARTTRQPQQRKTTFCEFCNDQPQGFHGDHELRRHIERQHTQYRKVWICRDISENGTFLRNCKACRNNKTYGANYNAAAHLRRTHFNPCKNKRGGRGKKSEGRGGMGGGNLPAMEELKKWMYEAYEVNVHGRVIVQDVAPDTHPPSVPMADLIEFDQTPLVGDSLDLDFDSSLYDSTLAADTYGGVGVYQANMMHNYQHTMAPNQGPFPRH